MEAICDELTCIHSKSGTVGNNYCCFFPLSVLQSRKEETGVVPSDGEEGAVPASGTTPLAQAKHPQLAAPSAG